MVTKDYQEGVYEWGEAGLGNGGKFPNWGIQEIGKVQNRAIGKRQISECDGFELLNYLISQLLNEFTLLRLQPAEGLIEPAAMASAIAVESSRQ
jgi:hypothetical protein